MKTSVFENALQEADSEKLSRTVRVRKPIVMDAGPLTNAIPKGTILILMSRKDKTSAAELKKALKHEKSYLAFAETVKQSKKNIKRVPIQDAVVALKKTKYFSEITFGNKILAGNLFLPGNQDVGIFSFPFAGGQLTADDFTIIDYIEDEPPENEGYEFHVLLNQPIMNPDTEQMIEGILQKFKDMVVCGGFCPAATGVAIAVTAADAALLYGVFKVTTQYHLAEPAINLTRAEIQSIGPQSSINRLLLIRKTYLLSL